MTTVFADTPAAQEVGLDLVSTLSTQRVIVLEPVDVEDSLELMAQTGLSVNVTMLDPWYNKGIGGMREDYVPYIGRLLQLAGGFSEHVFLWGFPEVVARLIDRLPAELELVSWLTWYYKNNPSVIRGWRSSQMACLHLARDGHRMYVEHFLNEAQLQKKAEGKLRYMPGPPSVIDVPLNIGFVGKKEQTGHRAQKPLAVYEPLLRMTTVEGDLVFDPMAGSGTTGAVVQANGRRAILADHSEVNTVIMEKRLEITRTPLPASVRRRDAPVESAVAHGAPAVVASA